MATKSETSAVSLFLENRKSAMSRCSWRFLFVRFPCQTAGDIVDVRQAAGDGFAVDADLGGGVHLREPAHDIKLHDLLIDLIQYALVSDALPVAAREVFQLLRQSQPRSYAFVTPFGPPPGRAYFMAAASFLRRSSPYL